MIQQLSLHPQLLPPPNPLLPHMQRRMMIQRILLQELFPQESPQLFPHPHPQPILHPQLVSQPELHPHPPLSSQQFVAAKSLILIPPEFLYTLSYVPGANVLLG